MAELGDLCPQPRQRVPSESDINSTTDEEDYDDDEFSDWDVDPFDSDDSFALVLCSTLVI